MVLRIQAGFPTCPKVGLTPVFVEGYREVVMRAISHRRDVETLQSDAWQHGEEALAIVLLCDCGVDW